MSDHAHYTIFTSGVIRRRRRFKLVASNGEQVGPASQSYRDTTDAERGVLDHVNASRTAQYLPTLATLDGVDVRYV